jgi:hypothetical protein
VAVLLGCRGFYADPIIADTMVALRVLAERHRGLTRQIEMLTSRIDPVVTAHNPALRAAFGVGPVVAAQLVITAGNNPDRLASGPLRCLARHHLPARTRTTTRRAPEMAGEKPPRLVRPSSAARSAQSESAAW